MSALLLSLMLAARPTVAVEVQRTPLADAPSDETMTTLRGWLVRRLLEEGYDVAAEPAGAHGVVQLRPASNGLVVETHGRGQRVYAVEGGADAVLRLEVLHRALSGVEQTCDSSEALRAPEPGLALRFVDGDPDEALLEAVAIAADDAQMTLTNHPDAGDTVACVARRGSLVEVALGSAGAECGPPQLVLDLGEGDEGQDAARRSAAQTLVDTARAANGLATEPESDEVLDILALGGPPPADPFAGVPATSPDPDADGELVAMKGPPRAEMRIGASMGVVVRGQQPDPLVQAGWRMGKINGLGGRLSVSIVPSSGGGIRVVDTRLAIGPDWEFQAGERGHVDLGLLVGTDMHTYTGDDRTSAGINFAVEMPISYARTLRENARLHVVATPGVASTSWEHRAGLLREGEVRWSRPLWRVGIAVAISHGWRIE